MHLSPAEPKPALMAASAASSKSASGKTIMWFLAPPNACTRFPDFVPVSYTYLAIGVEPTKEIDLIPGWTKSASTATLSPWTTLNTPSGKPASFKSWAINIIALGSFSEGLIITVFPQASAIGKNHIGTIAGKLNGEIIATGPSG